MNISMHSCLRQYTDISNERTTCFISREGTSVSNGPVAGRVNRSGMAVKTKVSALTKSQYVPLCHVSVQIK